MLFDFSKEQKLIQQSVREFGKEQLEPRATEVDRSGIYPDDVIKAMAELGFLGIYFPLEYEGAGADFLSYILMVEELSRFCASTGAILIAHCSLASYPIFKWGTEDQKKKYLTAMCSGKKLGGFAITNPFSMRSLPEVNDVVAIKRGENYTLRGERCLVVNGGIADVIIVFALTEQETGKKELNAFILEVGIHGLQLAKHVEKTGLRGLPLAEFTLENVTVTRENLLGGEGMGQDILWNTMSCVGVAAAAQTVGICQAALDASIKYANERVQFGKKIAQFGAIQSMIADMAENIYLARMSTYRASALIEKQDNNFVTEAAVARKFSARVGFDICSNALQIHGGYGYGKELILERLLRDVKGTIIYGDLDFPQRILAKVFLN